uniref:Uncharacterized protein n=1 Tax=Rhizophora mucronata TaxID=61149 RepID=A0A2P2NNM9_RHIMU
MSHDDMCIWTNAMHIHNHCYKQILCSVVACIEKKWHTETMPGTCCYMENIVLMPLFLCGFC